MYIIISIILLSINVILSLGDLEGCNTYFSFNTIIETYKTART